MKAVIIEDEQLATRRLETLIKNYDDSIEVIAKLESIAESVEWLSKNTKPDLIFLDIHLEDGLSFNIFEKVKVNAPVIFTTAFDQYAIRAFKLKSIDYLLKPITQEDLGKAIDKYREWPGDKKQVVDLTELYKLMQVKNHSYRERFSVSVGEKLKTIDVKEIAYFFSVSGITFVVMNSKSQYSLDISLDNLMNELDPKQFYRINRQYLISLVSIANVHIYPKSRLKIELKPPVQEEIFVSFNKAPDFRRWLDGE
jgi:DNA-binding LytR/AlgR family response regulator